MTIGSISCEQTAIKFTLNCAGEGQAFLVASLRSAADAVQAAGDAYGRIAETLREHHLEIVHERIFGSLSVERDVRSAREQGFASLGISPVNPVIYEDDVTLIQVSGTAAIDEHGVSLYPGDIRSQISCTFDKIESLLAQEGAGLRDIAAATVFVKSPEYASIIWEMAKDRGLEEFPAVCVVADVCREELLFEIDAEAAVRKETI